MEVLHFHAQRLAHLRQKIIMFLIVVFLAGIAAFLVGKVTQNAYHRWIGYNETETAQEKAAPKTANEISAEELTYTQKLKQFFVEIKDASKQKISQVAKESDTIQSFIHFQESVFILIDKAAFWIPFAFAFIVSFFLIHKLITLKQSLFGEIDPAVRHNIEAVMVQVNELEKKVQKLENS
ncbi:MAG: hypothetical protein AAB588_05040 [Patescibacteria group bacterium]